ncbi:MAG TPA: hypothetical protein VFD64_17260 [Gemmatimonadaceae bacterium]|nr:hypothetical protein [Gemmatimonadaceae bacterium]
MTNIQSDVAGAGAYEHVVVVMSIVLGLAVTQLLRGAAQLYRARTRVRTYWLHWAWTALVTVFSLLLWWTYWNYRSITDWDFLRFILYLSPTVTFYFLAAIAFPDPADGVVDLREYFYANRKGFFGAFATYAVLAGLTAMVVRGMPVRDPSNLFRVGMLAVMVTGMRAASPRIHAVLFVLGAALFVVFVAFFQFRLA